MLVRGARYWGADDPDEIAHVILFKVLDRNLGLEHPPGYWWAAIRHTITNERRRQRRLIHSELVLQFLPDPDVDLDIPILLAEIKRQCPREYALLMEYSRRPYRQRAPTYIRTRVSRARATIRAVLRLPK